MFVPCKEDELFALNKSAQNIFKKEGVFFPHMSLMYGQFSLEESETIQHALKLNTNALFNRLVAYKTEGEVKDWELLDGCVLY